jgi:mRNA interferase RelE/StbE
LRGCDLVRLKVNDVYAPGRVKERASVTQSRTRNPATTAMLIRAKSEAYATDPASQANNQKSLRGREGIRLCVGDWRVIMDDQGNVLAVLEICPRGGVYD